MKENSQLIPFCKDTTQHSYYQIIAFSLEDICVSDNMIYVVSFLQQQKMKCKIYFSNTGWMTAIL